MSRLNDWISGIKKNSLVLKCISYTREEKAKSFCAAFRILEIAKIPFMIMEHMHKHVILEQIEIFYSL